ncbi:MAG: ScyD/ScyE family protein [Verrucomicrobia bacterium]|nr:MAG: ScyD/ScyE family protein [Verrucomicrobiota bacterium]
MKKMKGQSVRLAALTILLSALTLASAAARSSKKRASKHAPQPAQVTMSVFATGLNNPRGLKFGPDGFLYVAEGGIGGSNSTIGQCVQVVPPVGPYTGSDTNARVSRIVNGIPVPVGDPLPSSQTAPPPSFVSGVGDIAFIGDTLYALLAGAGCSHGVPTVPNEVIRLNDDGSWTQIADLSAFLAANPVQNPDPDDFEPDGTWYSMIEVRGDLYAVEPNHQEIDRISPTTGEVSRVVDVSASYPPPTNKNRAWVGPTALAYHGNFFFGNLGPFPIEPGTQQVRKLTPSGQFKTWATGLTTVLGLAFDDRDRLYVLESMTNPGLPDPSQAGSGKIVRIDPSGAQTVVASGLSFPTAMTIGPDGALYVSNIGLGAPPLGLGQVLRITVP